MLLEYCIANNRSIQPYKYLSTETLDDGKKYLIRLESSRRTETLRCPHCNGQVHICGNYTMQLRDIPNYPGTRQVVEMSYHRYRCLNCARTFGEKIPLRYPHTRITDRAAAWIYSLLSHNLSISAIERITGIHWATVRRIQKKLMHKAIAQRQQELERTGYRPKHLAVDEFAIHKGHKYATCVMDLDTGDVLWVGKGRTKADFSVFFQEIDKQYLSAVEAVAMDMNASYNVLIREHMPQVHIVYDRYHLQAQFGKDVLGTVRLEEAKKHKALVRQLKQQQCPKADIKQEQERYAQVKRARWMLLTRKDKLSDEKASALKKILDEHADLAVCSAMKEELVRLFSITDEDSARAGWTAWFKGAKESGIPVLVRFAELKEKRLEGLIAHAVYPISTGKLEGFNNRIKVAKRIGYGYTDEDYFFSLIRYLSIPSVRCQSPNKT